MNNRDWADRGSNEILSTGVVFGVIAGFAVFLRFLAKAVNPRAKFEWDDWLVLVACFLFYIEDSLQIWGK